MANDVSGEGNRQPTAPFLSHVPRIPVSLFSARDISDKLPSVLPTWREDSASITVSPITGGITNRIFKATQPGADPSIVLIRIFGAQGVFSEEQRVHENIIFEQLGLAGHAPPLLALFENGRVETYIPARPLDLPEMVSPIVLFGVAKAMARLHTFRPADAAENPRVCVWKQVEDWAQEAARMSNARVLAGFAHDVPVCIAALRACRQQIEEQCDSPVKFCHNDLLSGNVLISDDQAIHIVDFEYSGWNYRGFDIANFFCEAMGGTIDGIVEPERYPSREERLSFCRTYLAEGEGGDPVDAQVQDLMREVDVMSEVAHLYWGFWALVQSAGSALDFPYVRFAEQRFDLYFKWSTAKDH